VLLADVVGSRRVTGFAARRDGILSEASRRHRQQGLTSTAYAVTAWDEFQAMVGDLGSVPSVIWDLRVRFHPLRLRVAVGWGTVSTVPAPGGKVNTQGSGPAFEAARRAMDEIRRQKGVRLRAATRLATGDTDFDSVANTLYRLHDALLRRITARQWEVVLAQERQSTQGETAAALQVDKSTVSRTLARAAYWELRESVATLGALLERRRHIAPSDTT
jgi:hypothetical protein